MVRKRELFLFFSLLLLGIFFVYLYGYIKQTEKDIFSRIESNKVRQLSFLLKNISDNILQDKNIQDSQSLIFTLSDKKTRLKYEEKLSLLRTPTMKYLYLIAKDEKDRFRFLLDASQTDKANFYQKFDVKNPKYKKLYKTKTEQVIRQENMENLFLTYLYPIIKNEEVIAILSIDLTTKIKHIVLELIQPLKTFFVILIIFIFLLMALTIIQVLHYFLTRKKIFTDSLTQLYNRHYLKEISQMLKLEHYSLAMLDLDRFKIINDTYGHKTGDFILSQSSEILKSSIRESDILIRYGGEEFLLFINNRGADEMAVTVCERIRQNIAKHQFNYDNHDIKMQVSIGLHEKPSLENNLNEAIKIADKMLYIAKSQGRNRVVNYSEKSKKNDPTANKSIDFVKTALDENRVVCFYQPIYDHLNHKILKYEALVRIIDKDGSIILPGAFLNGLKHTNIHYKLTQRILNIVFYAFKNIRQEVSININFSDLINEDIKSTIISEFEKNSNLASRITFEILESDEIENIKLFKEIVHSLSVYGTKISIDDFGSGYSNFKTILDIEANFLKIDGSLIKNIDINEKDYKVVKSILHFAKEANMKTIAEFVHSKEVYEKLLQLDVDYLQGYYIATPTKELTMLDNLFKS